MEPGGVELEASDLDKLLTGIEGVLTQKGLTEDQQKRVYNQLTRALYEQHSSEASEAIMRDDVPKKFKQEAAKVHLTHDAGGTVEVLSVFDTDESKIELADSLSKTHPGVLIELFDDLDIADDTAYDKIYEQAFSRLLEQTNNTLKKLIASGSVVEIQSQMQKIWPMDLPDEFPFKPFASFLTSLDSSLPLNQKQIVYQQLAQFFNKNFDFEMGNLPYKASAPKEFLREVAMILVQNDSKKAVELLNQFKKFGIENDNDKAKIAMIAMEKDVGEVIANIKDMEIKDPKALMNIAFAAALRDRTQTLASLKNFGIETEADRQEFMGRLQKQSGKRFREVVRQKVMPMAKGYAKPGAKILHAATWKESVLVRVNINPFGDPLEGRVYPSASGFEKAEKTWRDEKDGAGISYKDKYPKFEQFLNDVFIPGMSNQDRLNLIDELQSSKIRPREMNQLTCDLSPTGELQFKSPYLANWTAAKQAGTENRSFSEYLKNVQSVDSVSGQGAKLPAGEYIYVVLHTGELRIFPDKQGINCSSLAGGEAVLSEGKLIISPNRHGKPQISEVTKKFRQFLPGSTDLDMIQMMEFMEKQGVDVSNISFDFIDQGKVNGSQLKKAVDDWKKPLLEELKVLRGLGYGTYIHRSDWSYRELKEIVNRYSTFLEPNLTQDLAKNLMSSLKGPLTEMGYDESEMMDIASAISREMFPMVINPEAFKGLEKRIKQGTNLPQFRIGSKEKPVDFTFNIQMSSDGKALKVVLLPSEDKIKLGMGSYKKVKGSYTVTMPIEEMTVKRGAHIKTVMSRARKGVGNINAIRIGTGLQHEIIDKLGAKAKIAVLPKERLYLTESGEVRLEMESDVWYNGDMDKINKNSEIPLDYKPGAAKHNVDLADQFGVIVDTANSLQAFHDEGYVHRDVKPPNLFVTLNSENNLEGFLADLDLTQKTGAGMKANYWFWDSLSENGIVTPTCDAYGLVMSAGHIMLPRIEHMIKDKNSMNTPQDQVREYAANLWVKLTNQQMGIPPDTLQPSVDLMLRFYNDPRLVYNTTEATIRALSLLDDALNKPGLTLAQKQALTKLTIEIAAMLNTFNLIVEVMAKSKAVYEHVLANPLLQLKLKNGTDEEKKEAVKELNTIFPSASSIGLRLKEIQNNLKVGYANLPTA